MEFTGRIVSVRKLNKRLFTSIHCKVRTHWDLLFSFMTDEFSLILEPLILTWFKKKQENRYSTDTQILKSKNIHYDGPLVILSENVRK